MRVVTHTVRTTSELDEVVAAYLEADGFAFDVEAVGTGGGTGLNPQTNRVTWISLATDGRADVIPMGHPVGELLAPAYKRKEAWLDASADGAVKKKWRTVTEPAVFTPKPDQLRPSQVFAALEPLMFSEDHTIVGHNLKFDLASVAKYYDGRVPVGPYADTMMMSHLTDENRTSKGLKQLSKKLFDFEYENTNIAKDLNNQSFSKVATYALCDARATWMLYRYFQYDIQQEVVEEVFDLEMRLVPVLVDMELRGTQVDPLKIEMLSEEFSRILREKEKELFKIAGKVFNPQGTVDKRWFVYEKCGHTPFAFTDKGNQPSTRSEVLRSFAARDPRIDALMEHTRISKLMSSFTGFLNEETGEMEGGLVPTLIGGRAYPTYKPDGTVTGRFSCSDPNVQQIPSRSEEGAQIREAFVAEAGRLLVVADYSQVEYRILAHFCKDPTLLNAFENGWDPHAAVAAMVLGKSIEDVTKEERSSFKNFNFAQIYGAGVKKLAGMARMTETDTKRFLRVYEDRFPNIIAWKEYVVRKARERKPPYVRTVTGRKRRLPQLHWSDDAARYGAERQAVNSVVQGSAADAMKLAMVKVHSEIAARELDWKMQMTVHDELMLSVPEEDAEAATAFLKKCMESVDLFTVPLEVEASYGKSWGDCK